MTQAAAPARQAAEQARALFTEGMAQHQRGRLDDAKDLYRRVLRIFPQQADAAHMLGVAEFQLGRFAEAERLISLALASRPNDALAHFNLGNALRELGRLDAAERAYLSSLQWRPDDVETLKNLGNVLKEQNRLDEAIAVYDRVLALHPDHHHTRYNKALTLLMQGQLAAGWELYEYRVHCDTPDHKFIGHALPRHAPDWQGERLQKPLLVLPEQGLGDQIFYGAMLADIEAAGTEAFACLDARLTPLFRRSFPRLDFALLTQIEGLEPAQQLFGAQTLIGSLGRLFRRDDAGLARIRSPYLKADPERSAGLRARLQQPGKLVCGLSWSSKHAQSSVAKSLPLDTLLPLLRVPGIDFIDLQYGDTTEERSMACANGAQLHKLHDIDNKDDIDGLAALISACDLVVTVSNSTAHLAAALGKPTIILLPHHSPLWYWQRDGDRSPWYPSVQLMRQPAPGAWAPLVEQLAGWMQTLA